MLVFDNINDPELFLHFVPQSSSQRGSVLCTTQNSQLSSDQDPKNVTTLLPFDPEQGARFLMRRLKPASDSHLDTLLTTPAKAISRFLGGISLFLVAAAGFLSDSEWSVKDIVERYHEISCPRPGGHASTSLDNPLWYRHLGDRSDVFDYALQKLSARGREAISILAWFDGTEIAESLVFFQHGDDALDYPRPRPVSRYVQPGLQASRVLNLLVSRCYTLSSTSFKCTILCSERRLPVEAYQC